jgi:GDP-mannose transporter
MNYCSLLILTEHSYNHLIDGNLNVLLVVFQAIVALLCVETCKRLGWIDYPALTLRTLWAWAPVNIFFCCMLFTGMASLQTNSVPIVTIFKNVTNLLTAFGDYACFGYKPGGVVMAAFAVMLLGAVAAARDVQVTFLGIFWMMANCVSTSAYVLYMKYATIKHMHTLPKFGMVFVNNFLCIAILLPVALMLGEVSLFASTPAIHSSEYFAKNIFAGLVGFFLNFASLNCVSVTSPTTYAIIGSFNKIPVALLGYLLFDHAISGQTWLFFGISIMGGWLFTYAKIGRGRKIVSR